MKSLVNLSKLQGLFKSAKVTSTHFPSVLLRLNEILHRKLGAQRARLGSGATQRPEWDFCYGGPHVLRVTSTAQMLRVEQSSQW